MTAGQGARPRVLYVSYNFPPKLGGLEQVVLEVWQALGERAEVVALAQHAPGAAEPGVLRPSRDGLLAYAAFVLRTGRRLAREAPFDLVVGGSGVVAPLVAWLAGRGGARSALVLHGLDVIHPARSYQTLLRWALGRIDRVIANSAATRDEIRARGVAAERIRVVHPGCHGDRFADPRPVDALREQLGLQGRKVILSAGRLVRRKGIDRFVRECLPRVVAEIPEARLLLVGAKPEGALVHTEDLASEVRAAARTVGLESHVLLTGRLDDDDLVGAFQLADVFVLPAVPVEGDMEGFGIVLIEAAAAGLPTVAARAGGIPDAVVDGETGVLTPLLDDEAMAEALVGFLSDETRAREFGERGRRRALEGFLWSQAGPRYCEALLGD